VPYRPAPGIAVYHISVDDDVVIAAEHDLIGSLSDLVTAVLALGGELLEQSVSPTVASSLPLDDLDRGDRGGDVRAGSRAWASQRHVALGTAERGERKRRLPTVLAGA
jgi:hypothetical protein